jgi:hypothetical protein
MREKDTYIKREREREGEEEREREGELKRGRERERDNLKGMTGALAPFSYLVVKTIARAEILEIMIFSTVVIVLLHLVILLPSHLLLSFLQLYKYSDFPMSNQIIEL